MNDKFEEAFWREQKVVEWQRGSRVSQGEAAAGQA
jgi:hypothetical protein